MMFIHVIFLSFLCVGSCYLLVGQQLRKQTFSIFFWLTACKYQYYSLYIGCYWFVLIGTGCLFVHDRHAACEVLRVQDAHMRSVAVMSDFEDEVCIVYMYCIYNDITYGLVAPLFASFCTLAHTYRTSSYMCI